jgi:hypothetical protein
MGNPCVEVPKKKGNRLRIREIGTFDSGKCQPDSKASSAKNTINNSAPMKKRIGLLKFGAAKSARMKDSIEVLMAAPLQDRGTWIKMMGKFVNIFWRCEK